MNVVIDQLSVRVERKTVELLKPLSFQVRAGTLLGIIGRNGAGKSTLLKALAALVDYCGSIQIDQRPLDELAPRERAVTIAYLQQSGAVEWPLAVRDVVRLGCLPHQRSEAADDAAIDRALSLVGCHELADRRIDTLSGGEQARVLMARALAVQAPILLCDEPVANLDPYHQLRIMQLLKQLASQGQLVFCVLHDLLLAGRFCDRLLLLEQGELVVDGTPDEVLIPEYLGRAYSVDTIECHHQGQRFVLPWAIR